MIIGGILAGGMSRRVGSDKAGLVFDETTGETLGTRAVSLLRGVCDDVVILGHGRGLPEELERIADPVSDRGPLAGMTALLRSGKGSLYLVVPVDMPRLTPALLQRLLNARGDSIAACFRSKERREPLPLAIDPRALPLADGALDDGNLRLASFVSSLHPAEVVLDDDDALKNVNTLADLAAARSSLKLP